MKGFSSTPRIHLATATLLFIWGAATAWAAGLDESTLAFGRFGALRLYRQSAHPAQVVLFVSGDDGWTPGSVEMTRALAGMDALVVGIDSIHLLKTLNASGEKCLYPADDFQSLSKYVQKRLAYPGYVQPVLVGYSSGAALVYAVLSQAPANTFKAALSLGFCPDLPLAKPLCKAGVLDWRKDPNKETYYFLPAGHLDNPWVVLQGDTDPVCNAEKTRAFVTQVNGADMVMLPKVGHDFAAPKDWLPQFRETFARLASPPAATQRGQRVDLPLVEVAPKPPASAQMAVLITGDGGWAGIDREIAGELAAHGVGVVALDSLKYFWTARTPDGAARDLAQLLDYYLAAWHKEKVVLIGYSLGADVLPFMAARLPADIRRRVAAIALLAPGRRTAFEFHLSDWIGGSEGAETYPTGPEVNKLTELPLLCFHGEEESDSLCLDRLPPNVTVIPMAGGHHLGGDYTSIVGRILRAMEHP